MNALKMILLATVCAVAVSSSAFAGGKASAPASSSMWEGAYVGIQAGGATATTEHDDLDEWY